MSSLTAAGFAQAHRVELGAEEPPFRHWLFARRNAIFAAVPFAALGWWNALLAALALYAAASSFLVQHLRHAVQRD